MRRQASILALVTISVLLALGTSSQAIYIETPLLLERSDERVDVGDDVDLTITPHPENGSAKDDWAGKKVKLGYAFDKNEREASDDPDAPVSDADYEEREITEITLDDEARGSFTWTVPAEADGFNLDLFLEDGSGQRIAFSYLAVGDAPEQMRIASQTGPSGEPEPDLESDDANDAGDEDDAKNAAEAPGLALLSLLAAYAVGVSVLALRRH